jgi:hypothetical protein
MVASWVVVWVNLPFAGHSNLSLPCVDQNPREFASDTKQVVVRLQANQPMAQKEIDYHSFLYPVV